VASLRTILLQAGPSSRTRRGRGWRVQRAWFRQKKTGAFGAPAWSSLILKIMIL